MFFAQGKTAGDLTAVCSGTLSPESGQGREESGSCSAREGKRLNNNIIINNNSNKSVCEGESEGEKNNKRNPATRHRSVAKRSRGIREGRAGSEPRPRVVGAGPAPRTAASRRRVPARPPRAALGAGAASSPARTATLPPLFLPSERLRLRVRGVAVGLVALEAASAEWWWSCVKLCTSWGSLWHPAASVGHFYGAHSCEFDTWRVTGWKASEECSGAALSAAKANAEAAFRFGCVIALPPFFLSLSVVIR